MSQLTATFLVLLFGPMSVALVILGVVIALEKREARLARYLQPPQPHYRPAPPPPRTGRPVLTLVRN